MSSTRSVSLRTTTDSDGAGGTGKVYRLRDTKLDRDVALKVLPQAFTDDPDRLARFEREAPVLNMAREDQLSEAVRQGVEDTRNSYLMKPFDHEYLLLKVRAALTR